MERHFELWRVKANPGKGLVIERVGTKVRIARLDPTDDNLFDSIDAVTQFIGEELEFVESMTVDPNRDDL